MRKIVFIAVFFLFSFHAGLYACPMCNDLIERGKEALQAYWFAKGIAWSILLMMLMPFLLVGGVAWMIVRARRGQKSKENLVHGPKA